MKLTTLTAAMSLAMSLSAVSGEPEGIKHVLLISVDGLHALDVARYVESHPNSTLKQLTEHGTTYSNARTPANSDSFPGLLALVTGGSPVTGDLFYARGNQSNLPPIHCARVLGRPPLPILYRPISALR